MSIDDDINKKHENEYVNARFGADQAKSKYDNLMKDSYLDPSSAEKSMNDYRSKNGNQALYDKLSGNSRETAFGRRPGSILSRDGYRPGAADRRQKSQIARQDLPDAVRDHHQAQNRLNAAESAYKNATGQGGPGGGGSAPPGGPGGPGGGGGPGQTGPAGGGGGKQGGGHNATPAPKAEKPAASPAMTAPSAAPQGQGAAVPTAKPQAFSPNPAPAQPSGKPPAFTNGHGHHRPASQPVQRQPQRGMGMDRDRER